MTALRDNFARSTRVAVTVSTVSILLFIFCGLFIGLHYEEQKFIAFIITVVLVLIYQFFFADAVLMLVKGIYCALRHRFPQKGPLYPAFIGGPNRKKYLERRIAALRAQLELGPTFYKKNESMTQKYKQILDDLLVFGSYFVILIVLVFATRDPLAYYNNRVIKDVLRNPKFSPFALRNIVTSTDLYNFINGTLVYGFNDGRSYNGKEFDESGWMDEQISKLLGVIRLRQIRHRSLKEELPFETALFDPGWVNASSLLFKQKFWRVFMPWEHQDDEQTGGVGRTGKLYHQPGGGYVALLGRNLRNSERVLDFLRNNSWIDSYTAVVVIEFPLYSVDADLFTLVTITAEQTQFDSFVMWDKVDTLKLLFNIGNMSWFELLACLVYFFIFKNVVCYVVLRMWYTRSVKHYLSMTWHYVDTAIVVLNFFILIGVWRREEHVKDLLHQLEVSKRNKFIPFYHAAYIDETCTVFIAFLVALTTLRLWKILQFATVFRVLTGTLDHAKKSLMSTTFFIFIFFIGIGLGTYIINGSNSPHFIELLPSISSLMSLSFGFVANVTPKEMDYGGRVVGFLLYLVLAVVVSIFLLNMFITVLCLHLDREKERDQLTARDHYTFWHFLDRELCEKFAWRTGEKRKLIRSDEGILRLRGGGGRFGKPKEAHPNTSDQMRRMQLITEILDTQMELLRETMNSDRVTAAAVDADEVVEDAVESEVEVADEIPKKSLKGKKIDIAGEQPTTSDNAIRSA